MRSFGGRKHNATPLLSLVVVVLASTMIWSSDADEVHILNDLGYGWILNIHCASGDDDLGAHDVVYRGEFGWEFYPNVYGTTLFYCDIAWGEHKFHFDAYDAKRDDRHICAKEEHRILCVWFTDQYALYFWNQKIRYWDIAHFWGE